MQLLETKVTLNNLHFYAAHGVLPQERIVGGHYDVSLTLWLKNAELAVMTDRLDGTVNYAAVYDLVRQVMAVPSHLLEHVAGRILQILFVHYRQVAEAEVTVCKNNPPMGGDTGGASVTLRAKNHFTSPIRLLILDFDGTLADTSAGIVRTMKATFKECNYPQPQDEAVVNTIGLPLSSSIRQLAGIGNEEEVAHAVAVYRRLFEQVGATEVALFPEVAATLQELTGRGVRAAIATSRGRASVMELCRRLGIAPCMAAYVAVEDVERKKPEPESVEKLLDEFALSPAEALVVGDTSYDIAMGRAAGCPTCGVTYGNHTAEQLAVAGADVLVGQFGAIRELFITETL